MSRSRLALVVCLNALTAASFAATKPAPPPADKGGDTVVAELGDRKITRGELEKQVGSQLDAVRTQAAMSEYDLLRGALTTEIENTLLKSAAAKENKAPDAWLNEQIDKKLVAPTEAELQALYNQYKPRLGQQTLEQARPQLITMSQSNQRQRVRSEIIADLRSKSGAKIMLEAPKLAEGNHPGRGSKTAPVTLMLFSDYQCPYCSRVETTITQVRETYGDNVRIVFRDFPLSFHPFAQKAAEAAGCADEQGKFWEMHDKLFGNQGALQVENLYKHAADLGLDADKFKQCLDSGKRADAIKADAQYGSGLGVTGTPALFLNGRRVPGGAAPFDRIAPLIDEELQARGIKPPVRAAAPPPAPAAAPVAAPAPAPAKPAGPAAGAPAAPAPAPAAPAPAPVKPSAPAPTPKS